MEQIRRMIITCYGTHGSRQWINSKSIREEYKISVLVTEAYGLDQNAKQGKQTASSTKSGWRLDIVLPLIERLTPNFSFYIVTDNYLTSFHLFTYLGVNNILAIGVLNKKRLNKCTIIGDKQQQKKKKRGRLEQCTQDKKQCNFASGW